MRRWQHILKANAKNELPRRLVFFDCETVALPLSPTVEQHVLKLGVARWVRISDWKGKPEKGEDNLTFLQPASFWIWLTRKADPKTRTWCFSHNLAFDFNVLEGFTQLARLGWRLTDIIAEDPPTILRFRKGTSTLQFVDTLNYFPVSLKMLGHGIGLEKLDMPGKGASEEEWTRYCQRDVDIITSAILTLREFVDTADLGNWQPTIASQAFTAYRHRFMPYQIYIHDRQKASDLEREAYYGGRAECYYIGPLSEPLYMLDVNGLYPSVMARENFPCRLLGRLQPSFPAIRKSLLEGKAVIARVGLKTEEAFYPFRWGKRLLFPTGEFETVLATPELRLALDCGHVQDVIEALAYDTAPLFQSYVNEIYALRLAFAEKGNLGFAYMCKTLLNALYGKFGQRGRRWVSKEWEGPVEYPHWATRNHATGQVEKWRSVAGKTQMMELEPESFNSLPAISAEVTSYGRMALLKLINLAGPENVFYVDTDSLVVSQRGYDNLKPLISETELGALKLAWQGDRAVFYSPKDYQLGAIIKRKGIRANAQEISPGVFRQDKFVGFAGLWQNGELDKQYVVKVVKRLKREYLKGLVEPDGRVTPLKAFHVISPVRACEECGERTQDYDIISEPILIPLKAVGWVGAKFIDRERRFRDGGIKEKVVCLACLGIKRYPLETAG